VTSSCSDVLSAPLDQDELDISKDKDALDKAVKALNQAAKEELIQTTWVENRDTRTKMEEALKNGAAIFQYSGHADFASEQQGRLYLEDPQGNSDPYPAQQLAVLLGNAGVRLVVLSACESGRRNGRMTWSGLAPALTRERIPAVIANQYKIQDTAAILLSARLYLRLLSGYTVDEALFEARQAIHNAGTLEQPDWGAPVLYLRDTTGVLFPLPEKVTEGKTAGEPFLRVARKINEVEGETIEAEVGRFRSGNIEVTSEIGKVKAGGRAVGVTIKNFGS
jgi:CHAT domain-containing protein